MSMPTVTRILSALEQGKPETDNVDESCAVSGDWHAEPLLDTAYERHRTPFVFRIGRSKIG